MEALSLDLSGGIMQAYVRCLLEALGLGCIIIPS